MPKLAICDWQTTFVIFCHDWLIKLVIFLLWLTDKIHDLLLRMTDKIGDLLLRMTEEIFNFMPWLTDENRNFLPRKIALFLQQLIDGIRDLLWLTDKICELFCLEWPTNFNFFFLCNWRFYFFAAQRVSDKIRNFYQWAIKLINFMIICNNWLTKFTAFNDQLLKFVIYCHQ